MYVVESGFEQEASGISVQEAGLCPLPIRDVKRVACSTAVGGHDYFRLVRNRDPRFRYIGFSDTVDFGRGWEVYSAAEHAPAWVDNARILSKFPKICPFEVFPDAEWMLWTDACIRIRTTDILSLFRSRKKDADLYMWRHPARGCAYHEAQFCSTFPQHGPRELFRKHVQHMKDEGFPEDWGLWCAGLFLIRNTEQTRAFGRLWWSELCSGCLRDQVSLPYALWRSSLRPFEMEGQIGDFAESHQHVGYSLGLSENPDQSFPVMKPMKSMWTDEEVTRRFKKDCMSGQSSWYQWASTFIRPGDAVLDMGCGLGGSHGCLYARKPSRLIASDKDERVLKQVCLQGPGHVVLSPLDALQEEVDVSLLLAVIEHEENDRKLLRDVGRMTRRALVVSTPNYKWSRCKNPYHCREFTPLKLEGLLRTLFPEATLLCGHMPGSSVGKCILNELHVSNSYSWADTATDCLCVVVLF